MIHDLPHPVHISVQVALVQLLAVAGSSSSSGDKQCFSQASSAQMPRCREAGAGACRGQAGVEVGVGACRGQAGAEVGKGAGVGIGLQEADQARVLACPPL